MADFVGFDTWAEVQRYSGELFYQAPMDLRPVRVHKLKTFKNGKIRIRPMSDADCFTADPGHLDRFRKPLARLKTLGIAAAGVYGTSTSAWGECSHTMYDTRLEAYFCELLEGGIVTDKRPCQEHPDFVRAVVSGPMLKTSLPPGHCEKLLEEPRPCADAWEAGGWGYVSQDLYDALWRSLGARIGVRRGDFIVWDDGTEEPIRPAARRWEAA